MAIRSLNCWRCGNHFTAKRSDAKWCEVCRGLVNKETAGSSESRLRHKCPNCDSEIARTSVRCRPCATQGRIPKITGANNYAWKGGRTVDAYGYIQVLVAPEARKGHRYRAEHIVVWEAANGPVPKGWIIHHINGVKTDNRLENLEAMPRKQHNHRHDEHDRRIVELEAENAELRRRLDGLLRT